jgi:hypothetical protein
MELVDEGLNMARSARDPQAFFRGITEINKMQGYYEPEKRVVDVNVTLRDQIRQLETLSEDELLQRIGGERGLILDGEFEQDEPVALLVGPDVGGDGDCGDEALASQAGLEEERASPGGDEAEGAGGPDEAARGGAEDRWEGLLRVPKVEAGF